MMITLPEAFKKRMKELFKDEYEAFEASYEKERVQGLRFNSLKSAEGRKTGWEKEAVPGLAALMENRLGTALTPIPWVKEGYYYEAQARPGRHPFHEAGVYYIQEPSAMAVTELLDPQPGERILDLCAAPGGKSSHIASRLKGKGFLLSNEIHPARAKILSQNMERMGVSNGVVVNEEPSHLAAVFPEFFDGIVVDAPCSGEGMFRKDEEAAEQWSEEHVKMCAARQEQILAQAARMIKPGGRIVYSTCTFAPEENEGTVLNFLKCHEDFYLEETEGCEKFSHGKPEWAGFGDGEEKSHEEEAAIYHLERTFRLLPHCLEGEGHFIAVIRRREGIERKEAKRTYPAYLDRRKNRDVFSLLEAFLKESLADGSSYLNRAEYVMFGDQLYLLPGEMPDLRGLKVLRPGLHMGTVKKNRFEPSHALALSLLPEEAKRVYRMEADGEETAAYLRGEALSCRMESWPGNEKGWVLMCAEDWSLGWSKLSGGCLKNHYPKGLRRMLASAHPQK